MSEMKCQVVVIVEVWEPLGVEKKHRVDIVHTASFPSIIHIARNLSISDLVEDMLKRAHQEAVEEGK